MKIRNGFVSNSSSSSFVVLGYEFDRNLLNSEDIVKAFGEEVEEYVDDQLYEVLDENGYVYANHEENGARKNKAFFGINISETDESGYAEDKVVDCETLQEELKTIAKKLDIPEKYSKIKIISGTKMC